jgi:hypothetical protein
MLNKTRSDSRLSQLPPEQQAEIYRRLKRQSYSAVQRWLALPPPDGLGFKTHINSLFRFYHRYDCRVQFEQTVARMAGLNPQPNPELQMRIAVESIQEAGRCIATNRNCLSVFEYFSKFIHQREMAQLKNQSGATHEEFTRAALERKALRAQAHLEQLQSANRK